MLPSELANKIDELMKADLLYWRDLWFDWLLLSVKIVVIGLILEGPELIHEFISIRGRIKIDKSSASLQEFHAPDWVKIVALLGWLFIVVGVTGEWVTDAVLSNADSNVQAFNDILLAEATKEAGDAKSSAEKAEIAARRAKDQSNEAVSSASKALNLANDARRQADSVHQELVTASGQLTQLKAEAEKTRSDLINLAICNAPRVITNWFVGSPGSPGATSYVDLLLPMAGQKVFIDFVPDAETRVVRHSPSYER